MVKLEKIDLKKNTLKNYPDIKIGDVHLARINGVWYCGRFQVDDRDNSLYFTDSTFNYSPSFEDGGFQEVYWLKKN